MRRFSAALALFAAFSSSPAAFAGPDDYVFEFRLLDDGGREIVATCRGRAACVLDEVPLRLGGIRFAVEVETRPSEFHIRIQGGVATTFRVAHLARDGLRHGLESWSRASVTVVRELPAVLRAERFEDYGNVTYCLEGRYCSRPRRLVGSGYLMIRPLPLASGAGDAR